MYYFKYVLMYISYDNNNEKVVFRILLNKNKYHQK